MSPAEWRRRASKPGPLPVRWPALLLCRASARRDVDDHKSSNKNTGYHMLSESIIGYLCFLQGVCRKRAIVAVMATASILSSGAQASEIFVVKGSRSAMASTLPGTDGSVNVLLQEGAYASGADYRHVHIHGAIDVFDSVRLKQALGELEIDEGVRAVRVSICSPGGVYLEAPRMVKVIREFAKENSVPIVTQSVGRGAWSAAALVWLAGDVLQISSGEAECVVGFHAAYDSRDLKIAEQLLPEIKSLIGGNLSRMDGGVFRYDAEVETRNAPMKRDLGFVSDSICDYLGLAFQAKGSQAFLVLDDEFKVDLWEADDRHRRMGLWHKESVQNLYSYMESAEGGAGVGWWNDRKSYSNVEDAPLASWVLVEASCAATKVARSRVVNINTAALCPHVLFRWEGGGMIAPYSLGAKITRVAEAWEKAINMCTVEQTGPDIEEDGILPRQTRVTWRHDVQDGVVVFDVKTLSRDIDDQEAEFNLITSEVTYWEKFRLKDVERIVVPDVGWDSRSQDSFSGRDSRFWRDFAQNTLVVRVVMKDGQERLMHLHANGVSKSSAMRARWLVVAELLSD